MVVFTLSITLCDATNCLFSMYSRVVSSMPKKSSPLSIIIVVFLEGLGFKALDATFGVSSDFANLINVAVLP